MKKFFIVGCQRSGTTLVRLILNSHPEVKCFGESLAYDALENGFSLDDDIVHYGFQVPIWTELFVEYDCIRDKLKRGPDNPAGYPVLFLIRNHLEVVASMKRMPGWIEREVCKNMRLWLTDKARRLNERYGTQLIDDNPVRWASIFWAYKTEFVFDMLKNYRVLPVSYNKLVSNPRDSIARIVDFLGIRWSENLLNHNSFDHEEVAANGLTMGNTDARRSIDTNSQKKYIEMLTSEEKDIIIKVGATLHDKLKNNLLL